MRLRPVEGVVIFDIFLTSMSFPTDAPALPPFHSRVVPVIVITHVGQAVPLAQALLAGGVDVMEITLRHVAGLPAIEAVAREVPEMLVGAGTVTRAEEMRQVREAGARFALSPGMTASLVQAARELALPFMPGVMTPGEVMQARDWGFHLVKLFPAAQAGGLAMLKALAGPLGDMAFCPTGGISSHNLQDFLALPNVPMVGGSWLTPPDLVEQGDWPAITRLARHATELAASAPCT
jgi:2-dehydro-3-deoxyphosphogluconate aldolase/(4S)-4-hydroxy-2-oxoglutarate aldolase